MYLRLRRCGVATVLVLALTAVPATATQAQPGVPAQDGQGQPPASGRALDLETRVAQTLEANPGSTRISENAILVKPGIMVALPQDGEMSTQASGQCPRGWLCAWPDIDFGGPMMAVQRGVYINY